MSPRLAWILVAALTLPSLAPARAEEEIVKAVHDLLLEHLGAGAPGVWRPETATTFFMPGAAAGGDATRIIFAKDASGRVTHCIYRELGAIDRIVRKIE
jgi:hypothetical protein